MQLVDTHCHIHSSDYPLDPDKVIARAHAVGVTRLLCVGTTADDSELAVKFAASHPNCWASVGLHPHDAKLGKEGFKKLESLLKFHAVLGPAPQGALPENFRAKAENLSGRPPSGSPTTKFQSGSTREGASKIVAIGECGLDYFYSHSSREEQIAALKFQIELALANNLPLIFHVRDAFDDFWPIFDSYPSLRGVLHSFTDNKKNLDNALARGLYIGVNGIATFTKKEWQHDVYRSIPLERIILETDAPFLTPVPLRGTVNESAYVLLVCKFLAELRREHAEEVANQSTQNAITLFSLT